MKISLRNDDSLVNIISKYNPLNPLNPLFLIFYTSVDMVKYRPVLEKLREQHPSDDASDSIPHWLDTLCHDP